MSKQSEAKEKQGFKKESHIGIYNLKVTELPTTEQQEYKKQSEAFKPKQYQIGIDTFERMEKNCSLIERIAFVKGNIDKYNWREKNQDKEDFEKIINYAKWAIKQIENEITQ